MNQKAQSQFPFGTASKTAKRKALWLGVIWLTGGTALMFYISPFLLKKRFGAFNQAWLNAPIERIKVVDHGLAVQLHVKGNSYIFYPIRDNGASNTSAFVEVAQIGDYIKKESKSDTLYLLKSHRVHKILFKHF